MRTRLVLTLIIVLSGCSNTPASGSSEASATSSGTAFGTLGGNGGTHGSVTGGSTSNSAAVSGSAGTTSAAASSGTSGTPTVATSGASGSSVQGSSATSSSASATGSSGSGCVPDNQFASSASQCCSGVLQGNYCAAAGGSSGTVGNSGTSGTVTGGTSSGMCPANMPDLNTGGGTTTITGSCSTTSEDLCPNGYQCIDGKCTLNTSDSLQITMSFDNIEDFDLHLIEPLSDGGSCEIFYGNPGINPDAGSICAIIPFFCTDAGFIIPGEGNPCPFGWLDRDTNAACDDNGGGSDGSGGTPDGVNVENILFKNGVPPPSGTYRVRVDYWENCDSVTCSDGQDDNACGAGHVSSPVGIQVRKPTGEIDTYCQNVSEYGDGPNDQGDNGGQFADNGNQGAGFTVTTFTIP